MPLKFGLSTRQVAYLMLGGLCTSLIYNSCTREPFEPKTIQIILPGDTTQTVNPGGQDTITLPPSTISLDTVYFETDVNPILEMKCGTSGGCHSADSAVGGIVLDNYDTILNSGLILPEDPANSILYQRVTATDPSVRMPPQGHERLSAMEIQKVYRWILDGANEGSCDTMNISYASTVRPLMQSYQCLTCHTSGSVNFSDYDGVKEQAMNGRLYGAISHSPSYEPMPQNSDQMDSCHIAKIKAWIDAGAKNN